MQEAKQFPTAFFGFERKSVLDYIYEQDRQAREALEELARRNDVLDRKAAELGDKLAALTAQYQQAVAEGEEKERRLAEQGGDFFKGEQIAPARVFSCCLAQHLVHLSGKLLHPFYQGGNSLRQLLKCDVIHINLLLWLFCPGYLSVICSEALRFKSFTTSA